MENTRNKVRILLVVFSLIAPLVSAAVSDHAFNIEMSKTYNYGDGQDQVVYEFDTCIQVDRTVTSGTLQVPNGNTYPMVLEEEDGEIWLNFSFESADILDLAEFNSGTFIFTLDYANGGSDSTSVVYALSNGNPIPPVTQKPTFLYPLNEANNVPRKLTVQFEPATDPQWAFDLWFESADDGVNAIEKEVERLPAATSSYGPVTLTPNVRYAIGLSIGHAIFTNNADGIPTVMDTDAELEIYVTTIIAPTEMLKCTVSAKNFAGSLSCSGILNVIENDLSAADNVVVSLRAADRTQPVESVFPISAATLKKGKFSSKIANASFSLDTKTSKMSFSVKNTDLTGLSCPILIKIDIGAFTHEFTLAESLVNGAKLCPLELMQGVKNSLKVIKYKFKKGKTDGTDSLTISGTFTIAGGYKASSALILALGNQTFYVPGDQMISKNSVASCKAFSTIDGAIVTAKLDYAKCTFTISIKNAEVIESGEVDFRISCFDVNLQGLATININ